MNWKLVLVLEIIIVLAGVGNVMYWECSPAQAQCVAEIEDVRLDELRGSIIVETEYGLNCETGKPISEETCEAYQPKGRSRYLETSGTNEEIVAKAKEDIAVHCENLIRRIEINREYVKTESLIIQKNLTAPIIASIDKDLIGHKITKTEAVHSFKDKDIKVTYDSKNTVSDTVIIP